MLYAVGDIHGELDALNALLEALPLRSDDRLLFLGDYVDRGPDSRGVVDRLIALAAERPCTFLMGNHESMFLEFLGWKGPSYFGADVFLANGGARTLASYGFFDAQDLDPTRFRLPESHVRFYRELVLWHREADYLFVHAGLSEAALEQSDVDWALRRARPVDLLWAREHIGRPHRLGVTLVYGHTPSPDFAVRWNTPFGIGIDTGAVYGGRLTALRLPDETVFQV